MAVVAEGCLVERGDVLGTLLLGAVDTDELPARPTKQHPAFCRDGCSLL